MIYISQEITLLFEELDEDHDGKVSFDEFLNGLFAAKDHYNSQEIIEEEFTELQQSTPFSKPPVGGLTSTGRLKVRQVEHLRSYLVFNVLNQG